jgi:hypothetical protein
VWLVNKPTLLFFKSGKYAAVWYAPGKIGAVFCATVFKLKKSKTPARQMIVLFFII